ncbi:uncharacterized protein LOC119281395 [Triticum dicoccoides]|uniref:uncharacterized protein LOC119281395 n=1 Tax=Triticum dicoccoides TaxID=85692 RepID=UPI00188F4D47|nr:uncharacterized protein LOC119281395 [Triticum dicoccoides]XP_037417810.1 uncharacterized protein LOC119281395 [Triticum dicoccoides]
MVRLRLPWTTSSRSTCSSNFWSRPSNRSAISSMRPIFSVTRVSASSCLRTRCSKLSMESRTSVVCAFALGGAVAPCVYRRRNQRVQGQARSSTTDPFTTVLRQPSISAGILHPPEWPVETAGHARSAAECTPPPRTRHPCRRIDATHTAATNSDADEGFYERAQPRRNRIRSAADRPCRRASLFPALSPRTATPSRTRPNHIAMAWCLHLPMTEQHLPDGAPTTADKELCPKPPPPSSRPDGQDPASTEAYPTGAAPHHHCAAPSSCVSTSPCCSDWCAAVPPPRSISFLQPCISLMARSITST